MIARRDLLIGAACVAAAGAAWELTPRRRVSLLGHDRLEAIVPAVFGEWTSTDVGDLVAPKIEGSLASRLYEQTVGRLYRRAAGGAEIMMLLAYGDTQSNELQLHRPEVCYPAFGFTIDGNHPLHIPLPGGATLPARGLVATAPGRREHIIYWTRLGEYLPIDGNEQRADRLRTAFRGELADGVLARFSTLGPESGPALAMVAGFIPALLSAITAGHRAALIGTRLARSMARMGA